MPAAVESMMSVRELPWHGLGKVVSQHLTAEEALEAAGLDWEVVKEPLVVVERDEDGNAVGTPTVVPKRFATVRQSDRKVLGVVGGTYTVLQNVGAFAFADSLVDDGSAKYETAGSLRGGSEVWLMMKLPEGVLIAGEQHDIYLLLKNSHDGTSAIMALVTPVRVVCKNTLNLAVEQAERAWSVRHVGNLDGRLSEARRALELTFNYTSEFVKLGEELAGQSFSERQFEQLAVDLTDNEKHQERLLENYLESDNLGNIRGTKWGALNAVGEFYDWGRSTHGGVTDAAIKNTIKGANRKARDKALELLVAA